MECHLVCMMVVIISNKCCANDATDCVPLSIDPFSVLCCIDVGAFIFYYYVHVNIFFLLHAGGRRCLELRSRTEKEKKMLKPTTDTLNHRQQQQQINDTI